MGLQEDVPPTPTKEDDPAASAEPTASMEVEANKTAKPGIPTGIPTPQQKSFVEGDEASGSPASDPVAPVTAAHPEAKPTPPEASGADLQVWLFDQVQCNQGHMNRLYS